MLLLLPIALLAACDGGDGGTSTGGGGTGGSTTGGGGTGGGMTAGGGGAGGGTGGSATGGGGTGGSATGGGGAGGGAMGACTNDADQAILNDPANDVPTAVNDCAQSNFGMEPGTYDCIKMIGMSDGCTQCFDDTVQCVVMNCLQPCLADSGSQECTDCRAQFCDGPFAMCSGLTP